MLVRWLMIAFHELHRQKTHAGIHLVLVLSASLFLKRSLFHLPRKLDNAFVCDGNGENGGIAQKESDESFISWTKERMW
jgi:hypothetical protein